MAGSIVLDINLNGDRAEGHGAYRIGNDGALLEIVASANVACGYHGGDPTIMKEFCTRALAVGVSIGAHPGFADLQGFGRRRIEMPAHEVEAMVAYQIGALQALARAAGTRVSDVKPHGALANMAAERADYADAVARAIQSVDDTLIFVVLAGSQQHVAAERRGLPLAREGYADRLYSDDGNLAPRSLPEAVFHDPVKAREQAVRMVFDRTLSTASGKELRVDIDTICVHGDGPGAVAIAQAVRDALVQRGARITPLDQMALINARPLPWREAG